MEKPQNRLLSTNPIKRHVADPSALGLFAFAVITFLSGTIHCKWHTENDIFFFIPAVVYGGLAQIIAGTIDMFRGEKVGGSTFIAFGFYWMSQGLYRWPNQDIKSIMDPYEYRMEMGWYILAWTFVGLSSTIAVLRSTVMQIVLMSLVTFDFASLAFVNFVGNATHEKVTGYFLLVTAFVAWYVGTAILLRGSTNIHLPLGKIPGTNVEDPTFPGNIESRYSGEKRVV
eukprot:Protomagalhaensia_wolfi_Nauph_80__1077@NODE_1629_length_1432_cov_9_492462_g1262_i0_p1_GENE_NODE_1629_length_1432_cov_9_492462_g1262_i0NODE_1629_length_1432_cov_9_492462_g1262_i0_p1_ORF_typecomplete_len228_score31_35Gpr1_Fun34_YaaH/PF01184_19/1_4e40_NODE_1629_length_1432_cov_9_492462_g1262_i03501033